MPWNAEKNGAPPGGTPRTESLSLRAKLHLSRIVVEDALTRFRHPAVMWTGGKDSMLVLSLVREVCDEENRACPPILFIDHGMHFDETWKVLEDVTADLGLQKVVVRNDDVLSKVSSPGARVPRRALSPENQEELRRLGVRGRTFEYGLGSIAGNHLLKTVPMNEAIRHTPYDAVYTGIRWDENDARARERFISVREDPPHVRVHPVLHFTEREVWMETFQRGLPVHPLYEKGFRSLDGKYDSTKVADVPAWEQDFEAHPERAGRAQDKEEIMEKLRELGYM